MGDLANKISLMKMVAQNEDGSGMNKVLQDIYNMIDLNENLIKETYDLDREYSGRKESLKIKFSLDAIKDVIDYKFSETSIFESIDSKKVLEVRRNLGVIGVFYDGDILVTLDIICKALKTNNAVIFNIDINKNIGTNSLIIKLIKDILKLNNKPTNLVEINLCDDDSLIMEELDLAIVVGSKERRETIKKVSKCRVLESGYGYGEIYIEDDMNKEFIMEILEKEDTKLTLYLKSNIEIGIEGIRVQDVEEAIGYINKSGAEYSSSIFTNDEIAAKNFIRKIKGKYGLVNASPTLPRELDIDIEDLFYNKICIV